MTDKVIPFPIVKRMTPDEVCEKLEWVDQSRPLTRREIKKLMLFALQSMNEVDIHSGIDDDLGLPIKSPSYGWVDQFLATFEEKLNMEKV